MTALQSLYQVWWSQSQAYASACVVYLGIAVPGCRLVLVAERRKSRVPSKLRWDPQCRRWFEDTRRCKVPAAGHEHYLRPRNRYYLFGTAAQPSAVRNIGQAVGLTVPCCDESKGSRVGQHHHIQDCILSILESNRGHLTFYSSSQQTVGQRQGAHTRSA